jgi:hypothetical protein
MSKRREEFHERARELESAARMLQGKPMEQEQLLDLARQWRHMANGWTNVFGDKAQCEDAPCPKEGRRALTGKG